MEACSKNNEITEGRASVNGPVFPQIYDFEDEFVVVLYKNGYGVNIGR